MTANFQLALAKNRENYQSNIQRLKDIHKGDLKAKDEKHKLESKNFDDARVKEKAKLQADYEVRISEGQKKFQEQLVHLDDKYDQNVKKQQDFDRKERLKLKEKYNHSIDRAKLAHLDNEKGNPNIARAERLENQVYFREKQYQESLKQINNKNDIVLKEVYQDFGRQKEKLVKESQNTLEATMERLKEKYSKDQKERVDSYEKRLVQRKDEHEKLLQKIQIQAKDMAKKYSKELEDQLTKKDEAFEKERNAFKKAMKERDLEHEKVIQKQRKQFDMGLFKMNAKNEEKTKELVKRFQDKLAIQKDTSIKELEAKTNLLQNRIKNLTTSNEMAMEAQRDYYENKIQILNEQIRSIEGEQARARGGIETYNKA